MLNEIQHWGTGGSSPWIENIVIHSEEKVQDNLVRFVVEYDLASSNWHWIGGRKEITVERTQNSPYESWEITSIHTKFNEYEIFTPSETVSDTEANYNEDFVGFVRMGKRQSRLSIATTWQDG